jgi:hypothetical protein
MTKCEHCDYDGEKLTADITRLETQYDLLTKSTDHHCGYCAEILENTNESR